MNRDDICKLICKIENEHAVSEWMHNGYRIWPILRIYLYMKSVKKFENQRTEEESGSSSFFSKLSLIFFFLKDFFRLSQKKVNQIYVGAPSFCINYNGTQYNRYFDPIMDDEESSTFYFSRSKSKQGVYKPNRHLLILPFRMVFNVVDKIFGCFSPSTAYIQEFCEILKSKGFDVEGFEETFKNKVRTVDISFAVSQFLFKKLKPEKVWVLCYYSADVLGMLIAADKLSIQTIDMQHGGQGIKHLAYSNWINVPKEGYEALPNFFYTWDESSARIINTWAKMNNKHSAIVFGNPWVCGWKQNKFRQSNNEWPKNIILYTLQPIGEPLEAYILEAIQKTQDEWNWWLRLHPRQTNEKEKISLLLKEWKILEAVNLEEATTLPLPEILIHTNVHITKYSGCALEAYQFDVPSIIIDSRGIEIYKKYIDNKDKMMVNLAQDSQLMINDIVNIFCKKEIEN